MARRSWRRDGLLRFARNDGRRCRGRVGLLIGGALLLAASQVMPAWAASPTSGQASNINSGNTVSTIAPQLPTPAAGEDNTPQQFLIAARRAIAAGRSGEAQEALERAETRLLDRSTPLFRTNEAARGPLIQTISEARQALGAGDRMRAEELTGQALERLGPRG